ADATFRGWTKDIEGSGTISQATRPSAPTRGGNEAGKVTLPEQNKRAELYVYPPEPRGAERWYAGSIFIPEDWKADEIRDIVMQWHEGPDWDLAAGVRGLPR